MSKLALYGGEPLRNRPFPSKLLGVNYIGKEELEELKDVITEKSPFRFYGLGNPHKVEDFEKAFKTWCGCEYALAVSSGSAALNCVMAALGIGPGDEVILPAFGWFSDFHAIANTGALPVFAGIDATMNLDPWDFEKKITTRTKAVVVVHYQGGPANMDEILRIAQSNGIAVIEDCAQALGASYKGKLLGTLGDAGICSFQSNKVLCCGEGGIIYTNNEELFVKAVRHHDLGFIRPVFRTNMKREELYADEEAVIGSQYRMSELCGAFMLAQFRRLPHIIERCRQSHNRIREYFKDDRNISFRPTDAGDIGITLFIKFMTPDKTELFQSCLIAEGIPVGPSSGCCNLLETYPVKTRKQSAVNAPPFGKGYAGEMISYEDEEMSLKVNFNVKCYVPIGISPLYSDEDIDDIINAIEKVKTEI